MKLPKEFYTRSDTVEIARELLGKQLFSKFNNTITSGIIVETEAYCGPADRGCHAFNGRYTNRTKVMYEQGGVTYVYLCYGIHYLFNIITNIQNEPHAILIRAIEPKQGIDMMLQRTGRKKFDHSLGAGPGLVSQCFGFNTQHTGLSLISDEIWLEDAVEKIAKQSIIASARVGMNFEGHYKTVRWRFRIKNSAFTSKAR